MEKPKAEPKVEPKVEPKAAFAPIAPAPKPPEKKTFCGCGQEALRGELQCWQCAHRS